MNAKKTISTILFCLVTFRTNVCDIGECMGITAFSTDKIVTVTTGCHKDHSTPCIYTIDGKRFYLPDMKLESVIKKLNECKQ